MAFVFACDSEIVPNYITSDEVEAMRFYVGLPLSLIERNHEQIVVTVGPDVKYIVTTNKGRLLSLTPSISGRASGTGRNHARSASRAPLDALVQVSRFAAD